ncbi:helix-turn-helix transcriptional regulator [Roseateles amylovorans]|uniref:Helix-turn-helix transcriptional regulator n=1 Tax=Roseateles amylovorans TaxID=2978473 RepID=A0ABY6AWL6_9BURK|nr:helix-turn-helix transcriptional regulator [Roseateles amylovorans]UXH77566.1 helix-turn-helix transcriptional regulator [Roseateles amylovorans]
MHTHDAGQLTFAASGMVQVHTDDGRWLVPPQLAVWVPAGAAHRVEALTDAELWIVHWQQAAVLEWAPPTLLDRRAFALRIGPLLRALLEAAFATELAPDKTELVIRLMLHELTETADAPTFLPWPVSPVGRRMAELAFADPRNRLSFSELASRAATSVRSASRVFPAETGLTFKTWRQRARIVRAIDRLARGEPIARVSQESGFASAAAFSFAFRQVTAMAPTEFLARAGAMETG